ncbi:dUTP diphosphatase [Clostridium rectalis]|uniref:dUTP diphosphatase n=1 Tax=Clostridium rectalis TaxID=2040295 RepID=UPI000F63C866|nr:dUTP diphosphatase [Clostridium rectalis]
MNLQNLFAMQEKLDQHIIEQHGLHNEPLLSEKLLALQVEIAELANETRCFKFWSNKGPSSKEVILEEYVDCLHFILTIGIDEKYTDFNPNISNDIIKSNTTDQFLNLYIDLNDFIICSSKDHYETLFEDFLSLGISLGFSEEDIERGYYKKNMINHERQVSGY